MKTLDKNEIITLSSALPAVSTAAIKLIALIDDPKTSRSEIIDLVKSDQVLFAGCFKLANSAAVGVFKKFLTINEIVETLGISLIKRVALYTAAKSVINDAKIWYESVFTALAADFLAKKCNYSFAQRDIVYMAGLFQNYGSFLLKYHFGEMYNEIQKITDLRKRLAEQKKVFGFDNLEITLILLENFKIPEYVIEILRNQCTVYSPEPGKENIFLEIARLLFEMQDRNVNLIREKLDTAEVSYLVTCSGIEIVDIDSSLMSLIKEEARQLV